MTDYSFKLPEDQNVHKPKVLNHENLLWNDDTKSVLSVFDTDSNGITADELMQAFDYFVQKEKEIAITGKKGDRIITSKDIEEIVKTDSQFDTLRKKYNDDSKVMRLLSQLVRALCTMVTLEDNENIIHIGVPGVETHKSGDNYIKMYNIKKVVQ